MLRCKQCLKICIYKYGNISPMNDFEIMIFGYCIHFFDLITFIGFQCPVPNAPCNFQRFYIGNSTCPNCFNKVLSFSRCIDAFCGMNRTPHARIPMMPNKISRAIHTNKGHLTYSIFCAWAWSSSHSNFVFFFTLSKAFFRFRLACGLFKIQTLITQLFSHLGPST